MLKRILVITGGVTAAIAGTVLILKTQQPASVPQKAIIGPTFGVLWQEAAGNPVIKPGDCFSWTCGGVSDPAIWQDPSGQLSVWFAAIGIQKINGSYSSNGPYIAKAAGPSSQLSKLTIAPDNPIIPIGQNGQWDKFVETPEVKLTGQVLTMWYLGYKEKGFVEPAIGQMTSTDLSGTAWSRPGKIIYQPAKDSWDHQLVSGPAVVKGPDGEWRLYYTGIGSQNGIGLLISKDGINWTPYEHNPVFAAQSGAWDDEILEQSVVYTKGQYYMWYSGWKGELKPDTVISIGLATSTDGINWTRNPNNPVLVPGSKGSWDDLRVLAPDVLVEPDGSLLMAAYGQSHNDIGKQAGYIGFWISK
ncbi:MAG: hypothetical protein KGJ93_05600 [Patescibacteria group bacterium]|nr:hypothetical protein [Patescibacteria group bacterium]